MRLVAVSCVLNEDDIIEAFVRHHAPFVDHHVLLDNGSIDRTVAILKKLAEAGLPITVFSNRAPIFAETGFNTFLYRYALEEQRADAVLFLDADEFLDLRRFGSTLGGRLAELPPDAGGLRLPMINYHATAADNSNELTVVRRIRLRDPMPGDVSKILLRRLLPSWGVVVDAGNHKATFNGKEAFCVPDKRVVLAHFSDRSRWRWLARVAIGQIKVRASAQQERSQNRGVHYRSTYEIMRDAPHRLGITRNFGALPPPQKEWVDDPIAYRGGVLSFTERSDERLKALRSAIAVVEALADQHARLIDANHAVRLQVEQWAAQFRRVI
ncbi:MAG TPA: glycosyltransferase family 2 protein [Acetobacteraceae bacterium]|jgi:glycosyltransferase involved in cell wall biosynthesis|nr:glycosyltransferase family 2 protein [Acetobacteraceae bacterium]